ncbi:DUF4147 domain-containing protein [Halostella sp. JP-L12]|uniref:glycerate kinase type-2 family protein n=1 Tax=Halostella TaxID=1843185 RepID=UPI000EF7908C|nr:MULTISPECIES: DUF4147 domain-containing protein [Halostella]NHN49353.1 DUF4147 domain-containing protein [Halostella sp. JP-L12]
MIENRDRLARTPARELAIECVEAGIDAAHPEAVLKDKFSVNENRLQIDGTTYDLHEYGDIILVGGGNVAGHVAARLETLLGDQISEGVVVTDDPVPTQHVEVVEGEYPVPNEQCMAGARRVLQLTEEADREDLVLTVVSGGGSPLLSAPVADVSLTDLQELTRLLFSEGVEVEDINVVRKHLSAIKGGKLSAAAAPANVVSLVFSDVVGNPIGAVASGPTAPDTTTFDDALRVLRQHDVNVPDRVYRHLERGSKGRVEETPKPGETIFDRVSHHVLADGMTALKAARDHAQTRGLNTLLFSSRLRGDAREIAKAHVAAAEECRVSNIPVEPPLALISGGQTTIMTPRRSDIGPNQVFALSSAIEFQQRLKTNVALASVATDGFDGFAEVGGAVVDGETGSEQQEAWDALNANDTFDYLSRRDDLVKLGTTGTNVNDIHILIVDEVDSY